MMNDLRNNLAKRAMEALIAKTTYEPFWSKILTMLGFKTSYYFTQEPEAIAKTAYEFADAMIKEADNE